MKIKNKILYALLVVLFAAAVVFCIPQIRLLQNDTANTLLKDVLLRTALSAFLVCLLIICNQFSMLAFPAKTFGRAVLWSIPCILVAIVNFPFSALITGEAVIEQKSLVPLFALSCICIGVSEELLFRGILHDFIKRKLTKKKNGYLFAVLISAAVFGLWHLTNLLYGAGFGATMLQVGYSFLIGAMLAVAFDKTKNIWLCVFIHALFDYGGMLIETLGHGNGQDTAFWVLTVICGLLCAVHILFTAFKLNKGN